METRKWYYIRNMRSAYFPINSRLHRERKRETDRDRQSERQRERVIKRERDVHRERGEMVKTHKQYYVRNMTSTYFLINRRLHREREREKKNCVCERERERERE